ncbi:CPBP family intramembrane glutamic endopeptidase [Chloroflexota bacterium]
MNDSTSKSKFPFAFFLLTFLFAIPSYTLVALASNNIVFTPEMAFPFILLAAPVPIAAALILTFKENGLDGTKKLLGRAFDFKRIVRKIWYAPTFFLVPFVFILALGLMVLIGKPIPAAQFPVVALPVLILVFFIMALGEEVGWMGYAFEPMQDQGNASKATLVLGLIWATWHVPFYIFMRFDPVFIVAQVLILLGLRFLLVWIFNNTGESVFAAISFHAVYNVTNGVLPNYQVSAPLGVVVTCSFVLIAAIVVTILWGPKTLAQFTLGKK